jgi:hypothetical protein
MDPAHLTPSDIHQDPAGLLKNTSYFLESPISYQLHTTTEKALQPLGVNYNDGIPLQRSHFHPSGELVPATDGQSSPAGRLTPRSGDVVHADEQLEDEDLDMMIGDDEDSEGKLPMTAAELRAHKRKMKRFRYDDHRNDCERKLQFLTIITG